MFKKYFLLYIFSLLSLFAYNQTDTLVTNDNNILVGKIKKLKEAVVTMSTSYSDSDFKIEWLKVKAMSSDKSYRIVLKNGGRFFGQIHMDTISDRIIIVDEEKGRQVILIPDLVYFEEVKKGNIFDILKLSLDFGYSFTSSTELHQLNGDINASYNKKRFGFSAFYSTVQNTQKDVTPTIRNNGGFGIKYFLHYGLFSSVNADYYSNNEQQLDLRSNYSLGVGKYIVRTNQIYFNVFVGAAFSNENYNDTIPERQSFEAKLGTEFHMFDLGNVNIFSSAYMFPSFTETGRLRTILKGNIKYDITDDFYIKTGIDFNYDTKPIGDVKAYDYVFTFGIGWEL